MERCVRSGGEPGGPPWFLADAMLGRLATSGGAPKESGILRTSRRLTFSFIAIT
jgi:hypothetical protein